MSTTRPYSSSSAVRTRACHFFGCFGLALQAEPLALAEARQLAHAALQSGRRGGNELLLELGEGGARAPAVSASRCRRSHLSSRRRASSRVRPCGRGAAAATGCCSTSARRPLLGAEGPAHRGRHVAKGPYHARPSSRRGRALGGIGGASSARELLCDASFWRKKMAQGGEDKATGQISHFLWLFN